MKASSKKSVHVVAGILRRGGHVLLGQRRAGTHLAGLWEFPGGKLEIGESPEQALVRELQEELGIQVLASTPLMCVRHHYADKNLDLTLYIREVLDWQGQPRSREGQALKWCPIAKLADEPMPAADVPIVNALQLSPYYRISPALATVEEYVEFVETALQSGNRLLQIRAKDWPFAQYRQLVNRLNALKDRNEALLVFNAGWHEASKLEMLDVDGFHWPAKRLSRLEALPDKGKRVHLASCHDADEIQLAEHLGMNGICLSPVYATASHPDATPLGEARFAHLCARTNLPVYALGGVGPEDLSRMRGLGAWGVAGIRAFMEEKR